MANDAVFHRPSYFAIMTGTAEFTFDDFVHIDVIATSFEFEAEISMADFAAKSNPVKPMGKYYRTHASSIRIVVNYYVAVLSHCRSGVDEESNNTQRPDK